MVETIYADVAGLYFRSVLLPDVGTEIPQHVHPYDHATYVGAGSVDLYVDGQWQALYESGDAIFIAAGKQHVFVSRHPMTRLCCVHHTESAIAAHEKESPSCHLDGQQAPQQ